MPAPLPQIDGKVCVITGANSGIGRAAAIALAKLGATIVLVCRDQDKGRRAAEDVRAAGEREPALEIADLSSMAEVRDLAGRLTKLDKIDVLLNNAGLILGERKITSEGHEYTFAVNHLAPFLLTNLLTDKLIASAPARVITVSSEVHVRAEMPFEDLDRETEYKPFPVYSSAKMANVMFTYELARRLEGTGVTANALHPGIIRSGFGREGGRLISLGAKIARPFLTSPEKGADTMVYLAASPDVAESTGGYYIKRERVRSSPETYDEELAAKLWEISEELTQKS